LTFELQRSIIKARKRRNGNEQKKGNVNGVSYKKIFALL